MKKGKLIFALVGITFCCAACNKLEQHQEYDQAKQTLGSGLQYIEEKTNDFVQNHEEIQKSLELVNEKIDATKEQVNALAEQAKAEAIKQYEQLKNNTKEQMKDSVNKKIDQAFEAF